MLTTKDAHMFASLARENPQLREWLVNELSSKCDTLIKLIDGEQMRRAQGYAQCLQTLIGHLDESKKSPRNAGSPT